MLQKVLVLFAGAGLRVFVGLRDVTRGPAQNKAAKPALPPADSLTMRERSGR